MMDAGLPVGPEPAALAEDQRPVLLEGEQEEILHLAENVRLFRDAAPPVLGRLWITSRRCIFVADGNLEAGTGGRFFRFSASALSSSHRTPAQRGSFEPSRCMPLHARPKPSLSRVCIFSLASLGTMTPTRMPRHRTSCALCPVMMWPLSSSSISSHVRRL